ncbi:MAG: metallopeptidase family protein [Propionibacteriaceae bacterium]|nr:metallopeptidase family protein [Propionibacteriaceae bacterium]
MAVTLSDAAFDRAVNEAIDQVPEQFLALLDNVVILVEDDPPEDDPDMLGVYDGVPLTERGDNYGFVAPDRIILYRNPLKDMCETTDELVDEIAVTVVHEIGHFFGIDDDELDEMGWG